MSRYPGGIITKNPITPAGPNPTGAAPGVWRLNDVAYWRKQGLWPDASADRYWPYTSLLLSTTALGNANNNLFVDSSGAFNPVSRFGNTTQGAFSPYSTNWSNFFDGNGDFSTVPYATALQFTGDFTVEAWVYISARTNLYPCIVSNYSTYTTNGGFAIFAGHNDNINKYTVAFNGSFPAITSSSNVTYNAWTHVALVRSGTTVTLYVNGVSEGTTTSSATVTGTANSWWIGTVGDNTAAGCLNGYVSNLRAVKGTAVYTSNFTVPAAPLTAITGTSLLTCQSNRFRDASSNNFTITPNGNTSVQDFGPFNPTYPGAVYNQSDITNWSGYFDGSGDYLYFGASSAFAFGTGDFTLEFFVYTSSAANQMVYDTIQPGISGGGGDRLYVYINTSQQIVVGPFPSQFTTTGTVTLGAWNHVAVVRSGTTRTVYINGVSAGSDTNSTNYSSGYATIGFDAASGGSIILNGYLSNLRAVKGTAVYTSNFTPPTSPLTAISGTSLLTCQNAAFTDNSTNNFIVTQNGNPTVTGNSPFNPVGYWSNYFDGAGDYLSGASWSSAGNFGTADFTVECWVYATGAPQSNQVIWSCNIYPNSTGLILQYAGSGATQLNVSSATGAVISASAGWSFNQWHHIAVVRSGTTLTLYVDGVSRGSATFSNNCTDGLQYIGRPSDVANYMMQGYISNFRIVKGTAVYTGAFTPPTTPLTAISGTSLLTCQNGRFIDNSTNAYTITVNGNTSIQSFDPFYTSTIASNGGSMYFDGSGDYLTAASPSFAFGTGAWTVEFWIYPLAYGGSICGGQIFGTVNGATSGYSINLGQDINSFRVISNASGSWADNLTVGTGNGPPLNAWSHMVVVRSGANLSIYRNGTRVATTGSATSWNFSGTTAVMGRFNEGSNLRDLNGYVSNLRVTGAAVYDPTQSTISVPTAPVNPTAASVIMPNGMNAGIYDATTINDMETVGNAQVSTVQSKFGGSSIAFDGSGDWLQIPASPLLQLTGDFTVEAWVYPTAINTFGMIFGSENGSSSDYLGISSTRLIMALSAPGGSGAFPEWTQTFSLNQWYHIAVTRSGSTIRAFVNGTQLSLASGSATDSRQWFVSGVPLSIGRYGNTSAPYYFNGYVDDARITKGVARYTSNFTPPTQAFPTY